MVVFGGSTAADIVNDVWVLENANGLGGIPNWTQLLPTGGPPDVRGHHSAVYDAATNRMIVFGGESPALNDIWVLENANGLGGIPNWIQLNPAPDPVSGQPPSERAAHTGVYNPATNRMVIFAGRKLCELPVPFNDVWVLTNATGLLDPVELLLDLTQDIIDLNLQQGISNSLDGKLDAAMKALDDINANNDVAAVNALEAIINAVEAQRGKQITNEQADELIAAAQEIIDLLAAE
jgi:hypothetical protein